MGDVVDHNGAVGVPVVHGSKRLVPLLTRRIPDLKFDGCGFVEGYGLGEEGSADGGLPVIIELILATMSVLGPRFHSWFIFQLALTKRSTSDDWTRC